MTTSSFVTIVRPGRIRFTIAPVALAIALATIAGAPIGLAPSPALAEPSTPAASQVRQPTATPTAESEYDRGVRARLTKDWTSAVEAQRAAVTMRPAFPEAWNELGFALRNQGRYPESLDAYAEALRLRPNYPEALEYLGEAYVKLGRLDDARKVLDRLRPIDKGRAQELAEVIQKGK